MPGSMTSLQCSIAAAAMSFARRMRSISCSVLTARASARSGVASSTPRRTPSNQSRVNVVGSPDHPVRRLRPERELEADRAVLGRRRLRRELEHASGRRPRIARVVALEEPDVVRPGHARRVLLRRLEADEHRLAVAREDARVVALHAPEVRQVEDVVGRAHDERVELPLGHERAHAIELRVVARPGHNASSQQTSPSRVTTGTRGSDFIVCNFILLLVLLCSFLRFPDDALSRDSADPASRVVPARDEDVTVDELGEERASGVGADGRIAVRDVDPVRMRSSAGCTAMSAMSTASSPPEDSRKPM